MDNHYLAEIKSSLPRILSLIDSDKTSKSYGVGDRYYWAWGLIDFGNATFQGCAHGFARLWESGLWPYNTDEKVFLRRIDSLFRGTKFLTRKDGSLEEAFPSEGSFCVTALVAFDLLCSIDLLTDLLSDKTRNEYIEIVRPLINFLLKNDESHAIISNHLATAASALIRWDLLIGKDVKATDKANLLLDRIIDHQSTEGWFKEYEGADPGYQTLCLGYLADIYLLRKDIKLLAPIAKSIRFLQYFVHPDGSFGGHYGSRCTRFYYPAGLLALAQEVPEAALISSYMAQSISKNQVVHLSCIDEPNLIPMFNSYAWAASLENSKINDLKPNSQDNLPCHGKHHFRNNFKEAGILIDRGTDHYSIINYKKGGVTYHFIKNTLVKEDSGVVIKSRNGNLGSNHFYDPNQSVSLADDCLVIRNQIAQMPKKLPTLSKFLILRILCLLVFRFSNIREIIKVLLVKYLITKPKLWALWNVRKIQLGNNLKITDQCTLNSGYTKIDLTSNAFVPFHMASQGYWQIQDEYSLSDSKF